MGVTAVIFFGIKRSGERALRKISCMMDYLMMKNEPAALPVFSFAHYIFL
jgi:hypothetical protein